MTVEEKLSIFDDVNFKFEHKYHSYTYNGQRFTSATKFIQQFHVPFDKEGISERKAKQTGRPQEEILKEWQAKNDKSIDIGSATHAWIENYFNGIPQHLPSNIETIKRINSFNLAYGMWLNKLKPVAIEKRIFHKDWLIAGTIDSLFTYNDKLVMIDFKTNEEFRDDSHPKGTYNKLLEPFEDLWQNHLSDYSLQVSLYSLILKEVADLNVDKCFLLHISSNGPKMWQAYDLREKLYQFITKK